MAVTVAVNHGCHHIWQAFLVTDGSVEVQAAPEVRDYIEL